MSIYEPSMTETITNVLAATSSGRSKLPNLSEIEDDAMAVIEAIEPMIREREAAAYNKGQQKVYRGWQRREESPLGPHGRSVQYLRDRIATLDDQEAHSG